MEPARYLKAFRRRWAWIVACILVALAAGWITTATVTPPQTTPPIRQQYSADVLLLNDGSSRRPDRHQPGYARRRRDHQPGP